MNEVIITMNQELPIGKAVELIGIVKGVERITDEVVDRFQIRLEVGTKDKMTSSGFDILERFNSHQNMESRPEIA